MPACTCKLAALAALLLSSALACTIASAGIAGQADGRAVIAAQAPGELWS